MKTVFFPWFGSFLLFMRIGTVRVAMLWSLISGIMRSMVCRILMITKLTYNALDCEEEYQAIGI
jgi:hypothetical protein